MKSTTRQFIKANQEVDRALEAFKEERESALSRQKLALERYEEEMREVGDLDDIDREIHQIESRQRDADHNIMRHINPAVASDDDEGDEYDDHFNECAQKKHKDRKEPHPAKKIIPSNAAKKDMRIALFKFLEACRNDEDDLELIYEQAKEGGGKVADLASANLFNTQKENLIALLQILDGYKPRQSRSQWSKDPDYLNLLKKMNSQYGNSRDG